MHLNIWEAAHLKLLQLSFPQIHQLARVSQDQTRNLRHALCADPMRWMR
jgi:hypothetical protein